MDLYIMKSVQEIFSGKKSTVHLLFCITVLVLFYAGTWSLKTAGFSFGEVPLVFVRFLFFLLCFYTGRWLCQSLYLQSKVLFFLLFTFASCFIIALSWWLVIKYIFNHKYAGFTEVLVSAMPFFIIGIVLGMLLKLIRATMRKQVKDALEAAEQKQGELNLLQSQLSPHFLFNTLNNMYSISIVQHELIPGLLLKLSELLRYTVYGSRQTFLPLQDEIDYINNYIDFEKIRIGDRLTLQMDIDTFIDQSFKIPPMLLIAFIENAFKHAKNTFEQKIFIDISLKLKDGDLTFVIKNSFGNSSEKNKAIAESSGVGLVNTIKRLNLLYEGAYELKQFSEKEFYVVQLRLKINKVLGFLICN